MNWRAFIGFFIFIIIAVALGITSIFVESVPSKWALGAVALGIIGIGLGLNSLIIAIDTNRRMNELKLTIKSILETNEELKRNLNEQKEQKDSHSNIVPTLQAFSQLYIDYISKQKSEEEPPSEFNNT